MKIALVHDYLREYGGAERVIEALHEVWPEVPLYTSFVDWKVLGTHAERFRGWDIRTSWVQKNPIVKKLHSPLRFLAPNIWKSFDLSEFDVVISSSGWFISRGVKVAKSAVHICYIHHPPRNLYGYSTGSIFQKYRIVRVYAAIINFFMRQYDFDTAQNVDFFIANSKETARRVKKFYRREASVIYPPVEISNIKYQKSNIQIKNKKVQNKKNYYLSVGRLAWAKRVDLAIKACSRLKLRLKIVGSGKEEQYLRSIAGPTIDFLGSVTDEELADLYQGAKALIFTALDEDFGIVPVEAMAHGTPVIALAQGGVLETVVDGETGILFDEPATEKVVIAIKKLRKTRTDWTKRCIIRAQKFSKERFKEEIEHFVSTHI